MRYQTKRLLDVWMGTLTLLSNPQFIDVEFARVYYIYLYVGIVVLQSVVMHLYRFVRRLDMRNDGSSWSNRMLAASYAGKWKAHDGCVTSVRPLEASQLTVNVGEDLIVTAGNEDGKCNLWTESMKHVGTFGQAEGWDLNRKSTWISADPVGYEPETAQCEKQNKRISHAHNEKQQEHKWRMTAEEAEALRLETLKAQLLGSNSSPSISAPQKQQSGRFTAGHRNHKVYGIHELSEESIPRRMQQAK